MNQPNYLIIDLKTGFYDGAYRDLTMAMEVYNRKKERDPQAGWMLVEEVMRTDNITRLPDHTFYPRHLNAKEDALNFIKAQLTSDDSDHDVDAENIYNHYLSAGLDTMVMEALHARLYGDRLAEIENASIPEEQWRGIENSFDTLAAELPYEAKESA